MKEKLIKNDLLGEQYYEIDHESGLKIFVMEKPDYSGAFAMFGTKYGSVDTCFRIKGQDSYVSVPEGIAHFLEHKLFEQPDGSNAFDEFSRYGANANAFTSFTNTCYLFSCTNHFEECFAHLLSYVQEPYFTKENIEKEQGIIGQEIRMYDDDGEWTVMFNMLRALYHNNPVRIDIAGTTESIAKIDKDILYNCYNTYYNPANMVVAVAGDIDADTVFKIVEKTVKKRENGKVTSIYPDEPASVCRKYIEAKSRVAKPLFNVGFKDNFLKTGNDLVKREAEIKLLLKIMFGKSSKFI